MICACVLMSVYVCGTLADCYETLTGVSHLLKVNVQMMFVYLRR